MFLTTLDYYKKIVDNKKASVKELRSALEGLLEDAALYKKYKEKCTCRKSMASSILVDNKIVCSTCGGFMNV